ncbi:MAG: hypothetical protein L0G87_08560 [Renibacterium salmoninarum]|nr:hypothetical protein [Renibacterium salmoninarum]
MPATNRPLQRFRVLDLVVSGLFLGSLLLFSSAGITVDGALSEWLLSILHRPEAVNLAVNLALSAASSSSH